MILFTSGSTGHPKGAVSTHRNVLTALLTWELEAAAKFLESGRAALAQPALPVTLLLSAPLFHVSPLLVVLLASLRQQRRVVLMPQKWSTAAALSLINKYRVCRVSAPAAMTGDLVLALEQGGSAPSLLELGGGGSSRAAEQVMRIHRLGLSPSIGWGMTETNAIGSSFGGPVYVARPRCTGFLSAAIEARVAADGELLVRGGAVVRHYWPELPAVDTDGWLHTGDLAMLHPDGMLEIVGRAKDMIVRGGENIRQKDEEAM